MKGAILGASTLCRTLPPVISGPMRDVISPTPRTFSRSHALAGGRAPRAEGELRAARRCCVLGCVVPGICIRDLRFRPCVPTKMVPTLETNGNGPT